MEKYFDAFLYFANWGTRILKLRLPSRLLDRKTADLYCLGESGSVRERKGRIIVIEMRGERFARAVRGLFVMEAVVGG